MIGHNISAKDLVRYEYFESSIKDYTHLQKDEMKQFVNNYFDKFDYNLVNQVAKQVTENKGFTHLALKDEEDNVSKWFFEGWGTQAKRYYKLGRLRLVIGIVMEALYRHCPVDTGFGITHGIRYFTTLKGAKIVIGRGIAEYLVHQSYPKTKKLENSAQNSPNMGWIDDAVREARSQIKTYGYKLEKDRLSFGSMVLYIVPFASGTKSIMNNYNVWRVI